MSQVKVVDLNRLHSLKAKGMKSICKWLGVNFTETLMESTFLGKLWHGNAANRKSIIGLNSQKAKFQWPELLDKYEISFIESKLKKELFNLGYKKSNKNNNEQINIHKKPSFFNIYLHDLLILNSDILNSFSRTKFSNKYTKYLPISLLRILFILKKSFKFFKIFSTSLRDYKIFKNDKFFSDLSSFKINATHL